MTKKVRMTEIEKEILRNVFMGKRNNEIAQTMHVSKDTVKVRISNICRKLNAINRTHATYIAVKNAIIDA